MGHCRKARVSCLALVSRCSCARAQPGQGSSCQHSSPRLCAQVPSKSSGGSCGPKLAAGAAVQQCSDRASEVGLSGGTLEARLEALAQAKHAHLQDLPPALCSTLALLCVLHMLSSMVQRPS